MVLNKKGLSSIVAVTLLLVVAVIAVAAFSGWFVGFQTDLQSEVSQDSQFELGTKIETLSGSDLYFKNNGNSKTIYSIQIDSKLCDEDYAETIPEGMSKIDLSSCINGLDVGTYTILVQTDTKTYEKSIYIGDKNLEIVKEMTRESNILNTQNLVSYWNFNDGSANDIMGVNNGALKGDARISLGNAIFDGSGDYIEIADNPSLDITEAITLVTRVKFNRLINYDTLIWKTYDGNNGSRGDYGLSLSYNRTRFASNEALVDSEPLSVGKWYTIIGTFDKVDMKLYVNGELKKTISKPTSMWQSNQPLTLGGRKYNGALIHFFNGSMDHAAIYNRALTPEEVQSIS